LLSIAERETVEREREGAGGRRRPSGDEVGVGSSVLERGSAIGEVVGCGYAHIAKGGTSVGNGARYTSLTLSATPAAATHAVDTVHALVRRRL